eukprot:CAMPEP_0197938126 /NCGR_PEP_ID=MMETSP1439-20131203/117643_1 /TAXON_ID=66791 /ORGANISM="Gonyaulax spinifera, Strain CCMP409" /LENGTH=95 /DNA_ID=CAMNT_0043561177 /DNA_START=16 /DNA_END=303 /DNA_ORIENTATION=+
MGSYLPGVPITALDKPGMLRVRMDRASIMRFTSCFAFCTETTVGPTTSTYSLLEPSGSFVPAAKNWPLTWHLAPVISSMASRGSLCDIFCLAIVG